MAIDNWVIGKIASTHDENDVVTVYTSAIDNLGLNGRKNKSFSFRLKEWEFDALHRVACINRHVKKHKTDMFGNYARGYDEYDLTAYIPFDSIIYIDVKHQED